MRHIAFLFLLLMGAVGASAQTEAEPDSVKTFTGIQMYGDYMLDLSLMNISTPKLTDFKLTVPDASKDFSRLFRLNPHITYSQAPTYSFAPTGSWMVGSGWMHGVGDVTDNLRMGSFQLKNGMRLNTYGQYDKDGRKVFNPSALPWERNNFKGAFELKSADGKFGFRLEVQQGY